MKQFFLMFALLCFSVNVKSQEVIIDTTSTNQKEIIVLGGNEQKEKEEPTCVYSNGEAMRFPKKGLTRMYNPSLGWIIGQCKLSDGTSINKESLFLITKSPNNYDSFDADSRILIRFTDQSVSTLHRDLEFDVQKGYDNLLFTTGLFINLYRTYVVFQLDSETREKLMNPSIGITKIRIVFTNGEVKDYELKGKRRMKFPKELRESYTQASIANKIRLHNSDDSTF